MKNDSPEIEKYLSALKEARLSDASKDKIRSYLKQYADFHSNTHSVRAQRDERLIRQVPYGTYSISQLFIQIKRNYMPILLIIAIMAGAGTSFAAERAVPGDTLYPVKIHVNESVRTALAVSDEAEVKLQTRLLERRLEEAQVLTVRGELSADKASEISTKIASYYEKAQESTNRVETKGDVDTATIAKARLEGSLYAHADVLSQIKVEEGGGQNDSYQASRELANQLIVYADSMTPIQVQGGNDVAVATLMAVDVRSSSEAEVNIDPTKIVARMDSTIKNVQNLLNKAESSLSAEANARIKARFAETLGAQADAHAFVKAKNNVEAYKSAQTALRIASAVETTINSSLRLNIDLSVSSSSNANVRLQRIVLPSDLPVYDSGQIEGSQNTVENEKEIKPNDPSKDEQKNNTSPEVRSNIDTRLKIEL